MRDVDRKAVIVSPSCRKLDYEAFYLQPESDYISCIIRLEHQHHPRLQSLLQLHRRHHPLSPPLRLP